MARLSPLSSVRSPSVQEIPGMQRNSQEVPKKRWPQAALGVTVNRFVTCTARIIIYILCIYM